MNIGFLQNNQVIVPNGLVTHFRFNEGTGATLYDTSTFQNHAVLAGSYAMLQSGTKRGFAMEFYDTSAYADTGRFIPNMPNGSAGSYCLWFKCSAATNNDVIMSNGNWSTDRNGTTIAESAGKFYFEIADGVNRTLFSPTFMITGSVWNHCVFTWDTANIKAYINGIYHSGAAQGRPYVGNVYPLRLGRDGSTTYRLRTGSLDDVRVYNRALNPEEVYMIYTGTS